VFHSEFSGRKGGGIWEEGQPSTTDHEQLPSNRSVRFVRGGGGKRRGLAEEEIRGRKSDRTLQVFSREMTRPCGRTWGRDLGIKKDVFSLGKKRKSLVRGRERASLESRW